MSSELKRFALLSCLCFLLALILSSSSPNGFVSAEEDQYIDCETITNNTYWNLTSLIETQITGHDSNNQWNYFLQMCRVAPACKRDGAMACQQSTSNLNDIFDTAFANDNIDYHYWTMIPGGIQLTAYGSGIYCQTKGNERKTVIQVYCSTNSTIPNTFDGPVVEGPDCTYTMRFNHTSGCGMPPPPPIAPPKTCSDTDQSKVTAAGFFTGAIVGAVLAVGVQFTYAWYKRRNGGGETNKGSGSTQWNRLGGGEKSVGLVAHETEQEM